MQHRIEPVRQLLSQIQAPEEDRHEEGRELLVRHLAGGRAADQEPELIGTENAAVALLADQVVGAHPGAGWPNAAGASILSA